jgi:poly(3-hydroxyalkanoate) synthetase
MKVFFRKNKSGKPKAYFMILPWNLTSTRVVKAMHSDVISIMYLICEKLIRRNV